jgi:UDP:flavonoid glycosyltransferase YjiC (YdhE family)
VVASGVGRAVAPDAPASEIATALRGLLDDPAAAREARRFAAVITGLGSGDAATRTVAGLRCLGAAV